MKTATKTTTRSYYYWIGERNDAGGLDSIGDTGHVDARSAQDAARLVAADRRSIPECRGAVVNARSEDHADTANATI